VGERVQLDKIAAGQHLCDQPVVLVWRARTPVNRVRLRELRDIIDPSLQRQVRAHGDAILDCVRSSAFRGGDEADRRTQAWTTFAIDLKPGVKSLKLQSFSRALIPCAAQSVKLRKVLHGGILRLALGMAVLLGAPKAIATDGLEISLVAEVRQEIEVSPGRRITRLVPARVLRQGQEIYYTVRIRNTASVPVPNVEVMQRIPQNTSYVPDSASGPGAIITVSADGGVTFGEEGTLTVTDRYAVVLLESTLQDKAQLTRPAMARDYTHLRWRLRNPLAPGAVALARFRAVFL
jgi:uncharacterized repeat protein (TIGR01451 family)